jgi:streptogramin lyase/plastocyanin
MPRQWKVLSTLIIGFFCGVATCWGADHVIVMVDKSPYFEPASLEVEVGDTVTWKNSGPQMAHIVITEDLTLFSDDINVSNQWSFTFKRAGIYPYMCFRHFFMHGTVVVKNPDGTTTSPPEHAYQIAFKEFVVPTPGAVPRMITANPASEDIWFTEGGGDFYGFEDIPAQNKLARIDDQGHIVEFATPTPNSDGSKVGVDSLTIDPTGNIWFTERLTNRIGRLDSSGVIKEFQLPRPNGYALGIDIDPSNRLWFAERYGNRIGWMTTSGDVTEIELPDKDSEPRTVFVDSHARVWYTARVANEIGYYDTAAGKLFRLPIPTKQARPVGICETSGGAVYFLEMVGNKIAQILNDQIIEHAIPTAFAAPFKCATDSQDNIWFTEVYGNAIAKFDTKTGQFSEYKIPTSDSRPGGITVDHKGRVWFTEQRGNKVAFFDPVSAQQAESHSPPPHSEPQVKPGAGGMSLEHFSLPHPSSGPGNDLIEERGALWFPELYANRIGQFDLTTHLFREFTLPTETSMPVGLALDREGIFWATEFRANKLARIDPHAASVEEFPIPTDAALPSGITVDEFDQIWLTELAANRIAKFDRHRRAFEEFELPKPESSPLQIMADGDGHLWVTASGDGSNYVGKFSLTGHSFEVFDIPTPNANPVGLLKYDDAIWVAEGGSGKLAKLDLKTRHWSEFLIPGEKSEPVKLASGAGGKLWITDGGGIGSSGGNKVIIFDTKSNQFSLIPMQKTGAKPMGIMASPDGTIWFTQQGANLLSHVSVGVNHGNI